MTRVDFGFATRISLWRRGGHLFVATMVLAWSSMATPLMPLMAAQCRQAAQGPGCHRMTGSPANEHACCPGKVKSEPKPVKMPGCPMHEGTPPNSCAGMESTCCAMEERESATRRTARPTKKSSDEQAAPMVLVAESFPTVSPPGREHAVRPGLRYEKPVLELKADLRI